MVYNTRSKSGKANSSNSKSDDLVAPNKNTQEPNINFAEISNNNNQEPNINSAEMPNNNTQEPNINSGEMPNNNAQEPNINSAQMPNNNAQQPNENSREITADSSREINVNLVKILEQVCKAVTPAPPPPPKPDSFSGDILQDPQVFINQLNTHIQCKQLTTEGVINEIGLFLTGEAALWFDSLHKQIDTFNCFRTLFIERYLSAARTDKLYELLYGVPHGDNERAVEFILRKCRLCRRLNIQWDDERMIGLIRRQLQPNYKMALGPYPIKVMDEFRRACAEIDDYVHGDPAGSSSRKPNSNKTTTENVKNTKKTTTPATSSQDKQASTSEKQLPQCRYCEDRHYHRHCPVLKAKIQQVPQSGEDQRAGLEPSRP